MPAGTLSAAPGCGRRSASPSCTAAAAAVLPCSAALLQLLLPNALLVPEATASQLLIGLLRIQAPSRALQHRAAACSVCAAIRDCGGGAVAAAAARQPRTLGRSAWAPLSAWVALHSSLASRLPRRGMAKLQGTGAGRAAARQLLLRQRRPAKALSAAQVASSSTSMPDTSRRALTASFAARLLAASFTLMPCSTMGDLVESLCRSTQAVPGS